MLAEVDKQVSTACGMPVTTAIASVGVGSWAQAVVQHYQSSSPITQVVAVEPDSSACLLESLACGNTTSIATGDTIMCGMNCGTVSTIAWPILNTGVWTSVAVHEYESHDCVQYLTHAGIDVGPCGAAPLAAARRLQDAGLLKPDPNAVVVLFSTEGNRDYETPEA